MFALAFGLAFVFVFEIVNAVAIVIVVTVGIVMFHAKDDEEVVVDAEVKLVAQE